MNCIHILNNKSIEIINFFLKDIEVLELDIHINGQLLRLKDY